TVQAGQAVTLIVKNDDLSVHTFTVHELGINEVVIGGSEKLIAIAAADPGNYEIVCEIPGHEAMTGTLVVEAAVP
ncbi:MAG: cupredoxin domain-containing protein, partial [Chloroflexi bacterium]|nr:cupredoxin domain-containing protein [Chloroflexota bacterium]